MELSFDPLGVIQSNGSIFVDIVRSTDHADAIPSCPGWTVGDLADHMADCWNFWSQVVAQGITDRGRLQTIETRSGLSGTALVDWLASTHDALCSAIASASPDQAAWSWAGSKLDVAWVQRRMVHESAVHLWDLANSAGDAGDIPTAIAADGVDEFLMYFMGHRRGEGEMKVGGTVHLHCTDTTPADTAGGEWFIASVKEPNCSFTREHRKGDAAVRGRAHDLQMWLWRRNGERPDGIEIIGNDVVARRFRAYSDLGF